MVGEYRLLEKLGEGGMGTVYLAEDAKLQRKVALKVMKKHVASEPISRERFFREARAAAHLEHDNIVAIHQVGEDNGIPFLAMPLLRGESLGTMLKKPLRLDLPMILKVGRDVAQGLAAAHTKGLIHRDIKPDNIWIEAIESDDATVKIRAKILDFGLARPQHEGEALLTHEGAVLGTPAYMAPEQARGIAVDQRADLFSLGCVLYEMSTGRRPFTGPDTMAILTSLIADQPPDPRSINNQLPIAFSKLIVQLLEKDPAKRPASAREVADALRKLQADPNTASGFTFTTAPSLASASVPSIAFASSPSLRSSSTAPGNATEMFASREALWAEEERSWSFPWVTLIVLVLLGLGGVVVYRYAPVLSSTGTLSIEVTADADNAYGRCEMRIYDSSGTLKTTLKPSQRKLADLASGKYQAEVTNSDDLRMEVKDSLIDTKKGKKIDFTIEGNKTTILLINFVPGSKGKKEPKDKGFDDEPFGSKIDR
ncbi:MAG: protein kinase [Planctomycetes bacterium]|nr:protein kinase [Planctomycetota bacterium]